MSLKDIMTQQEVEAIEAYGAEALAKIKDLEKRIEALERYADDTARLLRPALLDRVAALEAKQGASRANEHARNVRALHVCERLASRLRSEGEALYEGDFMNEAIGMLVDAGFDCDQLGDG